MESWAMVIGAAALLLAAAYVWWPSRAARREARLSRARRDFHRQRERLELKFVRLAAARTAPGTLRWDDCDFADDVAYVRNRNTHELAAFVAVTVAGAGGESPARGVADLLGNVRIGTAVFRFDRDHWDTDGRAILNLNPVEAIRFYRNDLEIVGQEMAGRA